MNGFKIVRRVKKSASDTMLVSAVVYQWKNLRQLVLVYGPDIDTRPQIGFSLVLTDRNEAIDFWRHKTHKTRKLVNSASYGSAIMIQRSSSRFQMSHICI